MGDGNGGVTQIEIIDLEDNLLYTPISRKGRNKREAISVEKYAEDKALLKAIRISLYEAKGYIDLSNEEEDDDVQIINPFEPFQKKPFKYPSVTEPGQSSNSQNSQNLTFICEICAEPKSLNDSFKIKGCTHSYCSDCMSKYVASKIQDNVLMIKCPETNCSGVLELEFCRSILPQEVFDRWGDALCESLILGAEKFYCPYKDCSALLINDGCDEVTQSQCPHCGRVFCAQCKVPWHDNIECVEFQKLDKDEREREDIMLMKLAQEKRWQRCPICKYYVERSEGCLFMKCRCGHAFCYNCAGPMNVNIHYCPKCKH